MVSLWPWRGNSSSTASFEKTLSTLSVKIAENQQRLDKLRASARRFKVLWSLYLTFAYLVYAIVLLLVVGYKNMGPYEWTGLAGGPVLIYGTRTVLTTYYNFRIESLSAKLKEQQEERAKTIQKLKDATKYDSTMELIEKYGGVDPKKKKEQEKGQGAGDEVEGKRGKKERQSQGATPQRTTMPPPPTANIQRRPEMEPTAEFAPNAEYTHDPSHDPRQHHQQQPHTEPPPQSHPQSFPANSAPESHWYDRVFDVLLGEDETAPKNRIVLICGSCRLVNGQAPPGSKTLADVGQWRCMACGAMNGELKEDEGQRIVREVLGEKGEGKAVEEEKGDE